MNVSLERDQVYTYTVSTDAPELNTNKPEHFLPLVYSININRREVSLLSGYKEKIVRFSMQGESESDKDFVEVA